jgi:hypothetical protein
MVVLLGFLETVGFLLPWMKITDYEENQDQGLSIKIARFYDVT